MAAGTKNVVGEREDQALKTHGEGEIDTVGPDKRVRRKIGRYKKIRNVVG